MWLVFVDWWPDFPLTYCYGKYNVGISLLFVYEFIFYNIIPIGYLALIHHFNFRINRLRECSFPGSPQHSNRDDDTVASLERGSSASSVMLLSNSLLDYTVRTTRADRNSGALVEKSETEARFGFNLRRNSTES